jgi:CHAT domain-containing protein
MIPSASILAQLRNAQAHESGVGSGAILALAGRENGQGVPLVEAGREVRDLASRFRGVDTTSPTAVSADSTLSDAATRDALLTGMAPYEVIHLAAHATLDEEHPWLSSVRLNIGNSSGNSVALTASAIARSRLRSRLVVLSTCRSAGGRVLPGEGVQGPAAAFLACGVPTVVATLWPVDDAVARKVMHRFYDRLADGETVAEALSRCQAELRRRPDMDRPFDWAGFAVVGDGDVRVPLRRRSPAERYAVPGLLLLLGIPALAGRPVIRCLRSHFAVIPWRRIRSDDDRGH